jgi:DNA polymerase-3 subunit alpha
VDSILADRRRGGSYRHLFEFADRVRPAGLNKTALEALIKAGALDGIDTNRRKLLHVAEAALLFADSANKNRLAGQDSLFGGGGSEPASVSYPVLPDAEVESRSDRLAMEKEVLGIYVSDHPLRGHETTLKSASTHSCDLIGEQEDGTYVKIAGVIAGLRTIVTKKSGEKMASLILEDFSGQITVTAFPGTYAKVKENLAKDTVVQMTGFVSHRELRGEKLIEVRLDDLKPLEPTLEFGRNGESNAEGLVEISLRRATPNQLLTLKQLIVDNPGSYEVRIQILDEELGEPIEITHHVKPTTDFLSRVRNQVTSAKVNVLEWHGVKMIAS